MQPVSLYVVTNKTNGKQYVGITSLQPEQRWALHVSEARSGGVRIFCRALRKYGQAGFDWQVVGSARTPDDAADAERTLIRQLQPSYNMTEGGDGAAGMHPEAKARKSRSLVKNWEQTYEQRCASLQEAAKRTDQVAKGEKISATKKLNAEKTREQSKARVAADGGAQIKAALVTRWASPDAQNYDKSFFETEEYREKQRINSTLVWAKRRGELDLWLEPGQ